jgi:hypothetical protein
MDHYVGVGDQRIDSVAVQDVALKVFGPGPSVRSRIERMPGHPDDSLDFRRMFERLDR